MNFEFENSAAKQDDSMAFGAKLAESAQQHSGVDIKATLTPDTASGHLPGMSLDNSATKAAVFCSADGPGRVYDDSLNGQNPRRQPAELGNAHHTVELIEHGQFQKADGSITAAGMESIKAAIAKAGAFPKVFQSYEGRTQEVQNHNNQFVHPPVKLKFDRDHANADTLMGSQPYISATVNGRTTTIPMRR